MSICPSTCISEMQSKNFCPSYFCLPVCLSVCLYICLSAVYQYVRRTLSLSLSMYIYLPICLPVFKCVYQPGYLRVCLLVSFMCMCLFVYLHIRNVVGVLLSVLREGADLVPVQSLHRLHVHIS